MGQVVGPRREQPPLVPPSPALGGLVGFSLGVAWHASAQRWGGRVLVLPDLGPSAVLGSPGLPRDQFLCLKNNLVSFPASGGGCTHRTFRAGRKE